MFPATETSAEGGGRFKWPAFLCIFFIFNLFLSAYFLDVWPTPNPVSRALPVKTFAENGTIEIDRYAGYTMDKSQVGLHYYSDKAPFPSFLTIPFYTAARMLGIEGMDISKWQRYPVHVWRVRGFDNPQKGLAGDLIPVLLIGGLLCGSIPFVLIVMLTFIAVRKTRTTFSPVVAAMLTMYGSYVFVYSGTFFNHVLAGALLLVGYILMEKRFFAVSGLFLGLAFISEYTLGLAIPVGLLAAAIREKRLIPPFRFVLGILPSVLAIMFYNFEITGSPFTMLNSFHAHPEYGRELASGYGFRHPTMASLWGLSFSGNTGLFVFAPVLWASVFYLVISIFKVKDVSLRSNIFTMFFGTAFFLLISSFFTWWGGWSYGPRYLVPLAVLLLFEAVVLAARRKVNRWILYFPALVGLACSIVAKGTLVYYVPDRFLKTPGFASSPWNIMASEINAGHFNANNFLSVAYGINPSIGMLAWPLLFLILTAGLAFLYNAWFETPAEAPILKNGGAIGPDVGHNT